MKQLGTNSGSSGVHGGQGQALLRQMNKDAKAPADLNCSVVQFNPIGFTVIWKEIGGESLGRWAADPGSI